MDTLFGQGLELMLLGMGMVFAFLLLLVFAMNRLAAFFFRFGHLFPDAQDADPPVKAEVETEPEIAIILAAIHAKKRKL